jgi:Ner family transcriptional regulator
MSKHPKAISGSMSVLNALSVSPLHAEDIKAMLRKKYGSLTAVGERLGLGLTSVSGAIIDPLCSQKLEKQLAELLELPPQSLWPDRWTAYGEPIPRAVRRQNIIKRNAA